MEIQMMEVFNLYNEKRRQNRGGIFKSDFIDKDNLPLAKITTTINIQELRRYEKVEDRPCYRLTLDILGDHMCQYLQRIEPMDAKLMLRKSLNKTNFLREMKTIQPDGEVISTINNQNAHIYEEVPQLQETPHITTPTTGRKLDKLLTPRLILSPTAIEAEKQLKILAERLSNKPTSIHKQIYGSSSNSGPMSITCQTLKSQYRRKRKFSQVKTQDREEDRRNKNNLTNTQKQR